VIVRRATGYHAPYSSARQVRAEINAVGEVDKDVEIGGAEGRAVPCLRAPQVTGEARGRQVERRAVKSVRIEPARPSNDAV
jgi:hypothetical protein